MKLRDNCCVTLCVGIWLFVCGDGENEWLLQLHVLVWDRGDGDAVPLCEWEMVPRGE